MTNDLRYIPAEPSARLSQPFLVLLTIAFAAQARTRRPAMALVDCAAVILPLGFLIIQHAAICD